MRAVIYARYSSAGQREESIEGQLKACYKYASDNDMVIIDEYIDRAASGTNDKRPIFQKLISDSYSNAFDTILVYQFDRFARNKKDSVLYKAILKENDVNLISVMEPIADDTSGYLLEGFLELSADYFSRDLSMKTKRGMKINAEKGKYNGSVRTYGYYIDEEGFFRIDEEQAEIVKKVFNDYIDGKPLKDIISELTECQIRNTTGNPFTHNSLNSMLNNKKYIGINKYGELEFPDVIPRIIDDDIFYRAQERLSLKKHSSRAKSEYCLSGKVFCGYCEAPMTGVMGTSRTKEKYGYYVCYNRKKKKCNKENISQGVLEELILRKCLEELTDENIRRIAKEVAKMSEERATSPLLLNLYKEKDKKEKNIENLMQALEAGGIGELVIQRIKNHSIELEKIKAQIAKEEAKVVFLSEPEVAFFLTKIKMGDIRDKKYKKGLINAFVQKIYLYDDKGVIYFNASEHPMTIKTNLLADDESESGSSNSRLAPHTGIEPVTNP